MENPFVDNQSEPDESTLVWTPLCPLSALPSEGVHYVELKNRMFAVLWTEPVSEPLEAVSDEELVERLRVLDDRCPHAGASLSAGHIEEGCIICPWHHWAFDINSGKCPDADVYAVRRYNVRIVGDVLEAKI